MDKAKRYFIHVDKSGNATGRVLHSMEDVKGQSLTHHEFVKAEELTSLKDKIDAVAAEMKKEHDMFDNVEVLYFINRLKELAK